MTKFKYVGSNHPYGMKDLDLAFYKIVEPSKKLNKNDIVDIPDTADNESLIQRLKVNNLFEVVNESKNVYVKNKKVKEDK